MIHVYASRVEDLNDWRECSRRINTETTIAPMALYGRDDNDCITEKEGSRFLEALIFHVSHPLLLWSSSLEFSNQVW